MFSKKIRKVSLFAIAAMIALAIFGGLFAGALAPMIEAAQIKREAAISVSADEDSWAVLNSNYAAFADGATYSFTDKDKFASYFADDTYESDTTTITVNRDLTHGTQRNPYVIDSFVRWKAFMSEMGETHSTDTSWTYGNGKYYVLACDLDFASSDPDCPTTLVPMWVFNGTFYGLGHTLKNYRMTDSTNGTSGNYVYFGMFRFTYDSGNPTVFTDLNLEYRYTNVPNFCGGFFGVIFAGSVYFLNCHVIGTATRATSRSMGINFGGFVGNLNCSSSGYTSTAYFYRCSGKISLNIVDTSSATSACAFGGGYVGAMWAQANAFFYDCMSDFDYNTTFAGGSGTYNIAAGLVAYCLYGRSNGQGGGVVNVYRCVTRIYAKYNGTVNANWIAQFYVCQPLAANGTSGYAATTFTLQDCYGFGQWSCPMATAPSGTAAYVLWPWVQFQQTVNSTLGSITCVNTTYGGQPIESGDGYDEWHWGIRGTCSGSGTRYNGTEASFWNRAANESAYKAKIWENKNAIREFFETAASDMEFTTDLIPVKSTAISPVYRIRYYNFLKSGTGYTREVEEPIDVSDPDGNYTYQYSATESGVGTIYLDRQTRATGLTLRGWTRNKNWKPEDGGLTWEFTPPAGMCGDVKYYAVWEATGITATISAQEGKDTGEYGESLVMEGKVVSPTITDPKITYRWKKGNEVVSEGTRSNYGITEFAQSGTYTFEYTLTDPSMPLVYATGSSSNSVTMEITAKSVKVNSFNVTNADVFAGMKLSDLTFTATFIDGDNRAVSGTAVWERPIDKVVEGENTVNIKFTPDDTGNYSPITLPVTFTAKAIKLTFNLTDVSDTIETTLNYQANYSAAMLLQIFEDAFAERLENDSAFAASVDGHAPLLDGKELADFNTSFTSVEENKTITVIFVQRSYTVTFDKADESADAVSTKQFSWNHLITPTPEAERSGYELLGWYYKKSGVDTKWDFATDRVTGDLTLTAQWKALNLHLENITASLARQSAFTALSTVTDSDITVVATYKTSDGDTVQSVIHLGGDGYTIQYQSGDQEVHYGTSGTYQITISYCYKGIAETAFTTETDTLTLTVVKIKVDTSTLTFPSKSVEVSTSGAPAKANEISATALSALPGSPTVTYEYRRTDGTTDVSWTSASGIPATTANIGEYFVYANFNTTTDYDAPPIRTTLKIRAQLIAVRVEWGTFGEATYDGTDKKPSAIQVIRVDNGDVLSIGEGASEYRVLGQQNNDTFISAGKHTMTIYLGEDLKFASGQTQSKQLTINKASVDKPTIGSYLITYNGDEQSVEGYITGDMSLVSLSGASATTAGEHTITVSLKDPDNYQWSGGTSSASFTLRWRIERMTVLAPTLASSDASFEYDGTEHSISELFSGGSYDDRYMGLDGTYRAVNASPAAGYKARVKLTDTLNYAWADSQITDFTWKITKAVVSKPSFEATMEMDYAGETINIGDLITGYDYTVMKLSSNASQKDAGTYSTTISLMDNNNYTWDDGTTTSMSVKWTINKVTASPVWDSEDTYSQDGGRHSPKIIDFTGLVGLDIFNESADVTYTGNNKTAVGSYSVTATLKSSWAKNYTIDANELKKGYRIIPAGETADTTTIPIGEGGGSSGGGSGSSGNGGGSGIGGTGNGSGGGTIGEDSGGTTIPSDLPLWQLIVGGISILLTFVFVFKSISEGGRCKHAKQKMATLSISPLILAPFLGLAKTGWTGIAFGCLGMALISFAVMMLLTRKRKVAEGALSEKMAEIKEEEARRREEAKEEEARRREDDFKMMMASMMNRPMPEAAPQFDVQALLTGMQESVGNMVAALLPATAGANANGESETVKLLLAQNSEMMDRLNNQPAGDSGASDERIRELEERLARQQQEQAAMQMQREEEMRRQQQEMMMRQEELIQRLMERDNNPPAVGGVGSNTTNSFVYEVEEEKLSIDRLTLAEAYEAMTPNSKKLFDELIKFVTSKPETAESDGKYAISFKYRAKPLFKLVIKRGIPTMAYSTEGEQLRQVKRDAAASEGLKVRFKLSELQVMDSSTLDVAKEVIGICMAQIDKDVEFLKEQKAAKRRKKP